MSDHYKIALQEISKKNPDTNKAFSELTKAMESGDGEATYALATWYLHGAYVDKDLPRAIMLLNNAANKNVPSACFDLAIAYETSDGVPEDLEKAFKLYVKAALYGDEQSFHEVGRCYFHGIGTDEDKKLADIWLEKAESVGIKKIKGTQLF